MKKFVGNFSLFILVIFVSTAAVLSGCSRANSITPPESENSTPPSLPPAPQNQTPLAVGDGRASYADIVDRVSPAVVNVFARRNNASRQRTTTIPDLGQPPEGGGSEQQPPVSRGLGSGVLVNSNGTILTNHHVVENADDVEIELTDKRRFKAKIIGSDAPSDLAVLKVEMENLPFLNLGDSDKMRVGDVVLAVGNPLGIGQTVTLGIISAKGRRTGGGEGSFEDFLQTDAPINRGNSGGALVNLAGELIGINSQILSTSGGSIGIGFAIPSNMARGVTEQLIKNGKVRRGLLGVNIQNITPDEATALNLKEVRGAIVSNVQPDSAAAKAGLKTYDIITSLNGERIDDGNSFRNRVAAFQPGTEINLTILRDGKEMSIKATLSERSTETAAGGESEKAPDAPQEKSENGKLGLGLQPLTPDIARRLQLKTDKGLVVTEVDPTGPAADAQIAENDVILEVNRQPVGTFEEIQAALQKAGGKPVMLFIARRGQTILMTIQPRK